MLPWATGVWEPARHRAQTGCLPRAAGHPRPAAGSSPGSDRLSPPGGRPPSACSWLVTGLRQAVSPRRWATLGLQLARHRAQTGCLPRAVGHPRPLAGSSRGSDRLSPPGGGPPSAVGWLVTGLRQAVSPGRWATLGLRLARHRAQTGCLPRAVGHPRPAAGSSRGSDRLSPPGCGPPTPGTWLVRAVGIERLARSGVVCWGELCVQPGASNVSRVQASFAGVSSACSLGHPTSRRSGVVCWGELCVLPGAFDVSRVRASSCFR